MIFCSLADYYFFLFNFGCRTVSTQASVTVFASITEFIFDVRVFLCVLFVSLFSLVFDTYIYPYPNCHCFWIHRVRPWMFTCCAKYKCNWLACDTMCVELLLLFLFFSTFLSLNVINVMRKWNLPLFCACDISVCKFWRTRAHACSAFLFLFIFYLIFSGWP